MSYDLYFHSPQEHAVSEEAFTRYFSNRAHFTVSETESPGLQAWYENEDTGVYFSIEFSKNLTEGPDESLPDVLYETGVAFNLNYNRPTFFAYEAMPLVEEFATEFGLYIYDPQDHTEDDSLDVRPRTSDELIKTWSDSNRGAVEIYREKGAEVPYLPLDQSRNVWQYMKVKRSLDKLLPNFFVPKYFLLASEARRTGGRKTPSLGKVIRAIVWGEGVFQLLPECDNVVVVKGEPEKQTEQGIISYESVVSQVGMYMVRVENPYVPNLMAIPEEAMSTIQPIFQNFRLAPMDKFKGIAFDSFVDVPVPD